MTEKVRGRDIVVIGGSAGSLEPLQTLISRLPADLRASVLVVVHIPSEAPSYLAYILGRNSALRVKQAGGKEKLEEGVVYVAPPDRHLLIEDRHVETSRGPRENRHRPAIDPLFRSAARTYGPRAIGVILSGELDDGASGLMAVRLRGGLTIVQDRHEAASPSMPMNAKRAADAQYELPIAEIADLIVKATTDGLTEFTEGAGNMAGGIGKEADKAKLESLANKEKVGKPSAYACPECQGVLWELEQGELLRFRCRVGHGYTADSLRTAMTDSTEDAIWASMRALEEKAGLLRRIASRSGEKLGQEYEKEASEYDKHVETMREMLMQNQKLQGEEEKERARAEGA
jgi:two-component system, chemotaxis family, protein-glutamate methylesterase/glutaminase